MSKIRNKKSTASTGLPAAHARELTKALAQNGVTREMVKDLLKDSADHSQLVTDLVTVYAKHAGIAVEKPRPQSLSEMLAAAGIDAENVNQYITEERFPVSPERFSVDDRLCLQMYPRRIRISTVFQKATSSNCGLGTLEQGLAYLRAHPALLETGPIYLLGSRWELSARDWYVPVLLLRSGVPALDLVDGNPQDSLPAKKRVLIVKCSAILP